MRKKYDRIEKVVDSLAVVLANKPWTALFVIAAAALLFVLGMLAR